MQPEYTTLRIRRDPEEYFGVGWVVENQEGIRISGVSEVSVKFVAGELAEATLKIYVSTGNLELGGSEIN